MVVVNTVESEVNLDFILEFGTASLQLLNISLSSSHIICNSAMIIYELQSEGVSDYGKKTRRQRKKDNKNICGPAENF